MLSAAVFDRSSRLEQQRDAAVVLQACLAQLAARDEIIGMGAAQAHRTHWHAPAWQKVAQAPQVRGQHALGALGDIAAFGLQHAGLTRAALARKRGVQTCAQQRVQHGFVVLRLNLAVFKTQYIGHAVSIAVFGFL
ncbi:hypothetical protein SDC9_133435 [bioreactor metagenome]|uniref:Uncharacterized protein n=1 Tax=bioreactor metagenome TaxID=1076179 RepID=A0A645DA92_9ZZZZ